MSNYYTFKPSINDAAQYQAAPRPFVVTGSILPSSVIEIQFPAITKEFTINKMGAGYLYFAANAPQENQLSLKGVWPYTFELKCKRLWLSNTSASQTAEYEIIAGLTGVEEEYILSGSGINAP